MRGLLWWHNGQTSVFSDIEKGLKYVSLSQKELESVFLGMFLWNFDVGHASAHSLNLVSHHLSDQRKAQFDRVYELEK